MQETNWIGSDDLQWIRREEGNTFEVINAYLVDGEEEEENSYDVTFHYIDLDDYTEAALESEIRKHSYDGIAHVKSFYGKGWKQIVAEIISENDRAGNESNMTASELVEYLESYSIPEDLMEGIR